MRGNLDRLPALLDRFKLPSASLDKEMATLSGGEKQRIALISAFLLDRPILLLDEATSALDAASREALAATIRDVPHVTVLSVTHDPEWLAFADRVVALSGQCGDPGVLA